MTITSASGLPNRSGTLLKKLTDLRTLMGEYQVDYYLVPSGDEHLNVSVPEGKQRRVWLSGFTGSAGDLLVGHQSCWLFVDSRYYEQAELQVDSSLIAISKLGMEGHLNLVETLERLAGLQTKIRFGFDPFLLAVEQFNAFLKRLSSNRVELIPVPENLVDLVRSQTESLPPVGQSQVFKLPSDRAGETAEQKLVRVRQAMHQANIQLLPLTNLNQIAWLFNLRGSDIPFIPLFIAYAIITPQVAFLCANLEKFSEDIQQELQEIAILLPYDRYAETLTSCLRENSAIRVLVDPKHTTTGTYQLILSQQVEATSQVEIVFDDNPIEGMKARKNPVEIAQMKAANLKASRAKTLTLKWLTEQLEKGLSITELDVKGAIEQAYQGEAEFQSLTFRTISGTGSNSSIVHYGTPSPEATLKPGDLFLLDSGAQYLGGTTDDTRTLAIGKPAPRQIERYTTVLIAHINCAMQRFPKGTTGAQLDAIARSALWQESLDFGHGTGHGVGAFLSGHEGPNGISKRVQCPFEPGMVTSIEPGYYEPGWGGIRLENLYAVIELPSDTGGTWYGFEPLTFIPFDKQLIDLTRLSVPQQQWLKSYHAAVVEKLAPALDDLEIEWLKAVTNLGSL